MTDQHPGQYPGVPGDPAQAGVPGGPYPPPPSGPHLPTVPNGYAGFPPPGSSPAPRNGLGLAAMILGIVCIPATFIYVGSICAVVAVIFGIIGLRRVRRGVANNRKQALTGLILGTIGVILSAVFIAVVANRVSGCTQYDRNSTQFQDCIANGH